MYLRNECIQGYCVISTYHVKICSRSQGGYDRNRFWHVVSTRKSDLKMFWRINNNPVYNFFTYISEICFVSYRWMICGLNKSNHYGDETKRLTYLKLLTVLVSRFVVFPLILFTLNIVSLKRGLLCWCIYVKVYTFPR